MSTYKFLEPIQTPQGPGFFLGYLTDGRTCQVTRRSGGRVINPLYPVEVIAPRKETHPARSKAATVSQVVDGTTEGM